MELIEGAAWHSDGLRALYEVLGWLAFVTWSISFYPQVVLNNRRKSVEGLNFDFLVFNVTKHTSYLIFNAGLFFSATIQQQYHLKYGADELIPVAPSDVAFSAHAALLASITLGQALFYQRGSQRVSPACWAVSGGIWLSAIGALVWQGMLAGYWLGVVTFFNYIQLFMTTIKYIPQARMNYKRKSTEGWSIGNILLDITGGSSSLLMMFIQSLDQGSWENFSGNVGKLGLSGETISFDLFFIVQHYVLYPSKKARQEQAEYRRLSPTERSSDNGGLDVEAAPRSESARLS